MRSRKHIPDQVPKFPPAGAMACGWRRVTGIPSKSHLCPWRTRVCKDGAQGGEGALALVSLRAPSPRKRPEPRKAWPHRGQHGASTTAGLDCGPRGVLRPQPCDALGRHHQLSGHLPVLSRAGQQRGHVCSPSTRVSGYLCLTFARGASKLPGLSPLLPQGWGSGTSPQLLRPGDCSQKSPGRVQAHPSSFAHTSQSGSGLGGGRASAWSLSARRGGCWQLSACPGHPRVT